MSTLVALPVLLPLVGALVVLLTPPRGTGVVCGLTAGATLGVALWLAYIVATAGDPIIHQLGGWPPPLGIRLVADGAAAAIVAVSAVVFAASSAYAWMWPRPFEAVGRRGRPLFWPVWLFLWAGVNAVFLAGDAFNMYVGIELTTLAAVTLVALGGTPPVLAAAMPSASPLPSTLTATRSRVD